MESIIKYKFKLEQVELVNEEPVVTNKEESYYFSLSHKGFGLFEEEYGKSLLSTLIDKVASLNLTNLKVNESDDENEEVELNEDTIEMLTNIMESKFIKALAAASYIKIENNQVHNNKVTVNEFKSTLAYSKLETDITFINKMLNLAINSLPTEKKKGKVLVGNKSKKK